MAHIHNQPGQHDFTASAFIFRLDQSEPKIILHRHKLLGKYLQFGGHVELYETPWQTVVREIKEESGYEPSQLKILQPTLHLKNLTDCKVHPSPISIDTHKFKQGEDHFHTDLKFAFVAKSRPRYKLADDESSDVRLFSRKDIGQLSDDDTFPNLREICLYAFDKILPTWQAVDLKDFIL